MTPEVLRKSDIPLFIGNDLAPGWSDFIKQKGYLHGVNDSPLRAYQTKTQTVHALNLQTFTDSALGLVLGICCPHTAHGLTDTCEEIKHKSFHMIPLAKPPTVPRHLGIKSTFLATAVLKPTTLLTSSPTPSHPHPPAPALQSATLFLPRGICRSCFLHTNSFFPDASMAHDHDMSVASWEKTSLSTLSSPPTPILFCLVFFWALITIWNHPLFISLPASPLSGQALTSTAQHWEVAPYIMAFNICRLNEDRSMCISPAERKHQGRRCELDLG